MTRFGRIAVLLLLLSPGCGGTGKSPEQAPSEQAPSNSPPVVATDSRAALAGSWSGATTVPGYGTVVATFTLDSYGSGFYFVTASGKRLQGPFKLLSWDDNYLVVEAKGHQERVHATLRGDKLWIDHALIGQVVLVRGQ